MDEIKSKEICGEIFNNTYEFFKGEMKLNFPDGKSIDALNVYRNVGINILALIVANYSGNVNVSPMDAYNDDFKYEIVGAINEYEKEYERRQKNEP